MRQTDSSSFAPRSLTPMMTLLVLATTTTSSVDAFVLPPRRYPGGEGRWAVCLATPPPSSLQNRRPTSTSTTTTTTTSLSTVQYTTSINGSKVSNGESEPSSSSSSSWIADNGDNGNDSVSSNNNNRNVSNRRLKRLKDLVWVREALEDLTAAEFACSVEGAKTSTTTTTNGETTTTKTTTTATATSATAAKRLRSKRAVDYEKLVAKLNQRISDMGCDFVRYTDATDTSFTCALTPGLGSGTVVYTADQRQTLLERLIRTRANLLRIVGPATNNINNLDGEDAATTATNLLLDGGNAVDLLKDRTFANIRLPDFGMEVPLTVDEGANNAPSSSSSVGPKLYVREDGTVDWDGALQDQAALRKFGTAVWARINGRDPEPVVEESEDGINGSSATTSKSTTAAAAAAVGHGHGSKMVTAKIEETDEIKQARAVLEGYRTDLRQLEAVHTAILNSSLRAGQAVAQVNLAALEPAQRSRIVASAEEAEKAREKVSYQTLLYELERIYSYLSGELGNPAMKGYISLQDRLNIAEFGLLESQVDNFKTAFERGESVDGDVLVVVAEQMNDFKRRLGIDYYVTGFTFDREAIGRWLQDLWAKTQSGLLFYVKGMRLFWNDILFCLSLVSRAAQGYTLKPREVRTIRRTFKDVFTFIPFVIILLIPLSPVGHVLVFGAIQRFFPDFFPSCFTEQRQNLLQLYETTEYSEFKIDEDWKAKMARLSEALLYFVMNQSKTLLSRASAAVRENTQGGNTQGGAVNGIAKDQPTSSSSKTSKKESSKKKSSKKKK